VVGAVSDAVGIRVRGRSSDNVGSVRCSSNDGATLYSVIRSASDDFRIIAVPAIPLSFYTTNTERARIDSSGNLLVGTTSGSARFRIDKTSVDGIWMMQGFTDGVEQLRIDNSGSILNVLNSYGGLSDIKLKENIVDATPKLEKLNQVRIVNFNLIGSEQKQLGVIAQELEQIFPGMVDESPDRDAEGNDLGTTTKAVKYSVFVPMLVKAIQELNAKVDAQAAEISALKGQS
jgi:hypothetical protein